MRAFLFPSSGRNTMDTGHLTALHIRLSHERGYLAKAKSDTERELRTVWIAQIEKEIAAERAFLGMPPGDDAPELDDDALMRELGF
jgi:hypothetical protein